MAARHYLVDSDVLITAKNLYYAFDLCPGFWKSLLHYHGQGQVFSVDRARSELLAGRRTEDLVQWVRSEVPRGFFLPVDNDEVGRAYTEVMLWVQRHPNYFDQAKADFATGADGWLVACAKVRNAIVVTNEQSSPASRRYVKLPDACDEFNVRRETTFQMLRTLGAKFDFEIA
ncbi:MAG: DUF4411 family protein [Gammaproteobacteria bacterium]|nr:DUF4411 family protein [Gammaproteobacteria bacterium]MYD02653.1 DUF4411 family protein [Gammaproteobacteria bacterium]MYI24119.1 DUF4411 family protein [Gammaproteobacteria bacterium]